MKTRDTKPLKEELLEVVKNVLLMINSDLTIRTKVSLKNP